MARLFARRLLACQSSTAVVGATAGRHAARVAALPWRTCLGAGGPSSSSGVRWSSYEPRWPEEPADVPGDVAGAAQDAAAAAAGGDVDGVFAAADGVPGEWVETVLAAAAAAWVGARGERGAAAALVARAAAPPPGGSSSSSDTARTMALLGIARGAVRAGALSLASSATAAARAAASGGPPTAATLVADTMISVAQMRGFMADAVLVFREAEGACRQGAACVCGLRLWLCVTV